MKKALRKWLIPPGYFELMKSKPEKVIASFPENEKFKRIHQGKRCFILATGPSINTQELTCLKDEICIAVGHFHLHKDVQIIKPAYHILAPMHPPLDNSHTIKYFEDFLTFYKGLNVTYFLGIDNLPISYQFFFNEYPQYKPENIHFIDYRNHILLDEKNCNKPELWDLTGEPFGMRTVIYGALQLAFYMGFSEVYMLGCDHDYLLDFERKESKHFYAYEKGLGDRQSFAKRDTEYWFYEYYIRWRDFRLMRDYMNANGTKVYNATKGGMLDVFDRVKFEDLF